MNTATRLGGFALGLAVVFAVAYGAGRVVGPLAPAGAQRDSGSHDVRADHGSEPGDPDTGHGGDSAGPGDPATSTTLPGGLLVSDRGYTLSPVETPPGGFAFRIVGPDGRTVTGYQRTHEQPMHLVLVRRDLSGYRHTHPRMSADGTWRVDVPPTEPGDWRAIADFTPTGGPRLTLGVDLAVPGAVSPRTLPAPASTSTIDGYTVTLDGAPRAGDTATLTLTISRGGAPVTDLAPHLGAYGHLVALRRGDLAYLHVHPADAPADGTGRPGPHVRFDVGIPSAGTYRLFFEFRHAGTVHTAEFTLPVTGNPAPPNHGHN